MDHPQEAFAAAPVASSGAPCGIARRAAFSVSGPPALPRFSEPQVRVFHEVLRAVEHQGVGDAVFLGVLHHIALEKPQIEDVDLRIVLHRELGEGVAVGILDEQELAALAAAIDHRLRLVGVQEHGVLVAAIQVLALINAVRFILAAVIGNAAAGVLVPRGDLLSGDGGQRDFVPGGTVEVIAKFASRSGSGCPFYPV